MGGFFCNLFLIGTLLCFKPSAKTTQNEICPQTTPKLEALPGQGWDSIRNKEMGRVLSLTYDTCRTTEDRNYLIPDNVYVVALKESNLQLSSELIEHWSNYSSVTSSSFQVNAGINIFGIVGVQGSFDTGFLNAKSKQVGDQSMTTRVQVRNTLYVIQSPSNQIDPTLKTILDQVVESVSLNNEEKARLLLELIVRDYGTHYITQAYAGAVLLEEDFIQKTFVAQQTEAKFKISLAAGAKFFKEFASAKFQFQIDEAFKEQYEKSETSSNIKAIGGAMIKANMTVDDWLEGITNNLVVIDRSGNPLSYLITPNNFPNVSMNILNNVRKVLDQVITDFYTYNTHYGCTDPNSLNFDFNANVDSGLCHQPANNYSFHGGFLTCNSHKTEAGDLCQNMQTKNPLTGDFKCEVDSTQFPLTTNDLTLSETHNVCSVKCPPWYKFWKSCYTECHDETKYSSATYSSYWCISNNPKPGPNTGLMFGGLYTSWINNPITKSRNCPPTYLTLKLAQDLYVCVSNEYDIGYQYSMPFGGFFSCQYGNPLSRALKLHVGSPDPYMHSCPQGFSQRVAVIDAGCAISYCIKSVHHVGQIEVNLPPFRDRSALYLNTTLWKSMSGGEEIDQYPPSGLGIAGIVVGCLVTLGVVVGGTVYLFRKRRDRRERVDGVSGDEEVEEREPLVQPATYGSTNSNTAIVDLA